MGIENLKNLRLQRKISVNKMAKMIHVSRYTIYRIEKNVRNVSSGTLLDYINALGDVEIRIIIK